MERLQVETDVQKETRKQFRAKVESWEWRPIDYEDRITAWSYLVGKAAFDYAAVKTALAEIKNQRDTCEFRPKTFFDFGSGVGTCYW